MTAAIDVTPGQHKIILDLLRRHLPDTTAWVYGSRVKGTTRTYSDLDMVVFSAPEQQIQVSNLREAFDESSLPFKVDLFVWDDLPENFKKNIEAEAAMLTEKRDRVIPSKWKKYRLSDVINLTGGGTPKRSEPEYWNGSIPWLSVTDFNNEYRYIDSAKETITELGLNNSSTKILGKGQLIISARGTVGALAQLSKPMAFNQTSYGIDAKSAYTTNDFLYYLIKHSISNFKQITHGAIFDTITQGTFDHVVVTLPPLPEQRAIAHILGSLDDKIEHNRRMNETLEAMAQALFKSWFVNFDPVIDNALAAGNPIPEPLQARTELRKNLGNARKPLPDNIRRLFPAEFRLTKEMGYIPAGWDICSLDQVADYMNGLACQRHPAKEGEEGVPVIKIRELRNGISNQTDRATASVPEQYIVRDGDILFSWSGSLMMRPWTGGAGVLNQHLFKVMSDKYPKWFIYFWTSRHLEDFVQIAADKATTMGHIQRRHLTDAKVSVPDKSLLSKADRQIASLFNKSIDVLVQSRSVEKLRDILLTKLLSGEIRIPDAENTLGEVS